MVELDERHQRLRERIRGWAGELRPYALEVDREPDLVTRLLDLPIVSWSSRLQIPPPYNPTPLVIAGERFYLTSALERSVFCEETARVDLALMLALPGASMCGALVEAIGDRSQKEWFYQRMLDRPTWTFFALTEPTGGSDTASIQTTATRDGTRLVLSGAKRFVSNASRAALGVVFFRGGPGPLELGAALVESSTAGLRVEPIETIGLRGARLGAITLDSVPVEADRVLGRRLSPVRRGGWGAQRTLNLLRPTVASMAVGLAQAAYDYVVANRRALTAAGSDRLERIARRIDSVRRLARAAAAAVDRDPGAGHLASAAKLAGADLAVRASVAALGFFGTGARLEHPLLDKFARDALGVEFMEGSGHVQRRNLFTGHGTGALEPQLP